MSSNNNNTSSNIRQGTSSNIRQGTSSNIRQGTSSNIRQGTSSNIRQGTSSNIRQGTSSGLSESSLKALPIEVVPGSELREHFTVETRFELDFSTIGSMYANQNFQRGHVACEVSGFRISPSFHEDKKILTVYLDISHPYYTE